MNNKLKSICLVTITICFISIAYDLNQNTKGLDYKVYDGFRNINETLGDIDRELGSLTRMVSYK